MAIDAATLIRAGGGIAFMAAGAVAFGLARGAPARTGHVALGTALVFYGAAFVVYNLVAATVTNETGLFAQAPFFLVATAAALVFLWRGPWRGPANERLLRIAGAVAAVLLAVQIATLWLARDLPDATELAFAVNNTAGATVRVSLALLALMAAERAIADGSARGTRALAALALGIEAWSAYFVGTNYAQPYAVWAQARLSPALYSLYAGIPVAIRFAVALAWLRVASTAGGRAAWAVSWGILGLLLAGQAVPAALVNNSPLAGIIRVLGALLVVYALTTGALDLAGTPRRPARRSTIAAGSLAVLFLVAQVAQPFVDARLGLVLGSVVATASLFLGGSLQRAWDRRVSAREEDVPGDVARREQLYLNAARLAVRDRRLTREEEAHLHALAEELGLGAKRAHELLVQAERDAGVA